MTRIAIVKKDKCFPKRCGELCLKKCPVNKMGQECIVVGEDHKALIDETLCTGCGICPKICPFKAVSIINLPEELKEAPIFRYGKNAFELFRLPIPQESKVVGIVGANGIGKTTALDLLAGLKKPNLGELEKEVSEKDIISFMKGTELQSYFENLFSKDIVVSHKPQYIDDIPERFKGTVKELIKKVSGRKIAEIKDMAEKLNISKILDQKISTLSGGELQRTAIATAILKPADLYFFDEPASYLDIKERVRVAKIIRELAKEKAVIVVEHDLIILDFIADAVHILFGKASSYGVVSHPMSSKNGINTYLAGYLRDENIRFRDEAIKFDISARENIKQRVVFANWPKLTKKLGKFLLEVEPSEIYNKELVGIIGANAIGKTTFMNILAGVIKPDSGTIGKHRISYKPQYIKAEQDNTVSEALLSVNKDALSQKYNLDILIPLELTGLLDKKITELSGGELQRVAIAVCLLREADIYLFDEPSTYLDVEQRLHVSRVIQKVIKSKDVSCIIIDHDLLFINYVSDRILVFEGEPSVRGNASKIKSVKDGMNLFLRELDMTLRKDPETFRPRVNKPDSQKDKEQRQRGNFYDF